MVLGLCWAVMLVSRCQNCCISWSLLFECCARYACSKCGGLRLCANQQKSWFRHESAQMLGLGEQWPIGVLAVGDAGAEPQFAPSGMAALVTAGYVVAIVGCRASFTPSFPVTCDVILCF
eukprot:2453390-Pyramimonas_sp.AAC.1